MKFRRGKLTKEYNGEEPTTNYFVEVLDNNFMWESGAGGRMYLGLTPEAAEKGAQDNLYIDIVNAESNSTQTRRKDDTKEK